MFTDLQAWDPCMLRWVEIMACTSGGGSKFKYGSTFFHWLDDQLLMVKDYAYVGTIFKGDPDLPLLTGAQWGDIGKNNTQDIDYFCILCFIIFMDDNEN